MEGAASEGDVTTVAESSGGSSYVRYISPQDTGVDVGSAAIGVRTGQRQCAGIILCQYTCATDDATQLLVGGTVVIEGAAVGDSLVEGCAQSERARASDVQGASGADCEGGISDSPCAVEGTTHLEGATTDGGVFGVGVVPSEG